MIDPIKITGPNFPYILLSWDLICTEPGLAQKMTVLVEPWSTVIIM